MREVNSFLPCIWRHPDVGIVTDRMRFVQERCRGRKVLHLGCVDEGLTEERFTQGNLLHTMLLDVAREVWGVDCSEEGLRFLREKGVPNLIWGNVEHLERIVELREQSFEVIVASEIIEHLANPGLFLESAKRLFGPQTVMILTTPNAFRLSQFSYLWQRAELVHPDHNFWFSWHTLSTLLAKSGYEILETSMYTFLDPDLPLLKSAWAKLVAGLKRRTPDRASLSAVSRTRSRRLNLRRCKVVVNILTRRYLYRRNPAFADGLIMVVRPQDPVSAS